MLSHRAMQTITNSDLVAVIGGNGPGGGFPSAQGKGPSGGGGGGFGGGFPSAQDLMGAKPADNRALPGPSSGPNNGGFKTNTPMVNTPDSNANIPNSVFSAMGL